MKQEVLHDNGVKDQYVWLHAGQTPLQLSFSYEMVPLTALINHVWEEGAHVTPLPDPYRGL